MKNTLIFSALLTLITSCSVQKGEHTKIYNLDEVKSDLTVNMKVDERIQITAKANPSTGYSWNITTPENCNVNLTEIENKNLSEEVMLGAPIRNIYNYTGVSKGECVVEFDYSRPWEGKSNQPKRIKFVVK